MKTQTDKIQEQQSSLLPKVPKESGTGGTAKIEDNRPATIYQRKLRETMNASAAGGANPIQRKTNNTGLPDQLKTGIENLSGYAMDDVKVHYNSGKPAQLQAHAYAQGTDIHLAPGQEKHLPHEAWHVVQQKQGRVKPTMQLKGKVNVNDDAGLEKEADVMGEKSLSSKTRKSGSVLSDQSLSQQNSVVQGLFFSGTYIYTSKEDLAQGIKKSLEVKLDRQHYFRELNDLRQWVPIKDIRDLSELLWGYYGESETDHMEMDIIDRLYDQVTQRGNVKGFDVGEYFDLITEYNKARINLPWKYKDTIKYDKDISPHKRTNYLAAWRAKKNQPQAFKNVKARAHLPARANQAANNINHADFVAPDLNPPAALGREELALRAYKEASHHLAQSNTLVLGRYRPTHQRGQRPNYAEPGADSYVSIARELRASYFNLGVFWDDIKAMYNGINDDEMFVEFNIGIIDEAVRLNKRIVFTHHPEADPNSALFSEWTYLQTKHGYTRINEDLTNGYYTAV